MPASDAKRLDLAVVQVKYPGTRPLVPDVPQGVPPPSTMEYVESYLPYLMTAHKKEGRAVHLRAVPGKADCRSHQDV